MPRFQVIALTLPGMPDPAIAIAASRAGGLGVLDLEYTRDKRLAVEAMQKLCQHVKAGWGVKLDSADGQFFKEVLAESPPGLETVILTFSEVQKLRRQVLTLRRHRLTVMLEVTSRAQAEAGQSIGVDGIIAKGHEAGGRVGEETTFILLQNLRRYISLPVFAQGGVGVHTAAACYAAGAAGIVLDWQLALTKESPLPEGVKHRLALTDGSETICVGTSLGDTYRIYTRPGLPVTARVQQAERQLMEKEGTKRNAIKGRWRDAIRREVGCDAIDERLLLMSQDAAFAEPLAKKFVTTGGILQGILRAIDPHCQAARQIRPLDAHAPLAQSHGTRYPIIQGAMTRVSDKAEFAQAVAQGGALPFLALALMRKTDVEPLLAETKALLGDKPWGVGILGFVPVELRQEQLEAIMMYRPPFALIAGGRPDQARALEQEGIATYLHVPSPKLLEMFLQDGATRFVFEGRECGGHVGPRTSFILWEQMIEELLKFLSAKGSNKGAKAAEAYHIIFAGGIHDALSASMVAVLAAPLAELGVRIGLSMGTSYIFTEEAVSTGAIVPGFQEQARKCQQTVLFETGPGHAIRSVYTPYKEAFDREKRRLYAEGKPFEEVRATLELMNLGRLRIASKGIMQHPEYRKRPDVPRFLSVSEQEQETQGLYMIGQVAGLRTDICTIDELHRSVTVEATGRLEPLEVLQEPDNEVEARLAPSNIAIIGMACLLPKAPDLQTYWHNILTKVDAITEIPKERWDWEPYYDPDRFAKDKIYSKWGGFLDDVHFDPLQYGIPPNSLRSIEPLHLLTLEVVRAALDDAGYLERSFPRERTSVILGASGGADLGGRYGFRSMLPYFLQSTAHGSVDREAIVKELSTLLPEWTEDSFAGILTNVAAGRVANRFDLGGRNFTVDAACAASLAAVDLAVRELEAGTSDMVIVGGADTMQSPFAYLCFSKTHALSPRGRCHTFDDSSDGIAISEGVAAIILKRLADAERDGDRIYAVIKGVGGSSDGKDKGMTAPRPEGQMRALRRAYAKAHVSPATVELIEAHGTGTAVGDQAEVESLRRVFSEAGAARQSCGLGSVKSMIGHTKCTAGVASVIKVAMALYHQVLPPTINVEKPNSRVNFPETPFYVNTEARPWIKRDETIPRRAGVSAFGFGGTNFHAVLEEYTGDYQGDSLNRASYHLPSELFLWRAPSRQALMDTLEPLEQMLTAATVPVTLPDLAYTLHERYRQQPSGGEPLCSLAIVAASVQDLRKKLARAREALFGPNGHQIMDPRGIYYTEHPMAAEGKVAFLFPGQGSQQPNMLKDLVTEFVEVRGSLEQANHVLKDILERPLSSYVFPIPTFTPEEQEAARQALTDTRIAQPALGAVEMGVFQLLSSLGVQPDCVAGHSYGEYVALCAAGVLTYTDFIRLSEARGRFILEGAGVDPGAMAAVESDAAMVQELIADIGGVGIANLNSPSQTIISGTRPAVDAAVAAISAAGKRAKHIPVACAFHSPLMVPAQKPLAAFLGAIPLSKPQIPVFANATAGLYPKTPKAIAKHLVEHLVRPVQFQPQIEAMYTAGVRIFVEVGPGAVLTNRVGEILGERPHLRVAADQPGRPSVVQLHHLLGQLAVHGVPVQCELLYRGRDVKQIDLKVLATAANGAGRSSITWLVNGSRAKPLIEQAKPSEPVQSQPAGRSTALQPDSAPADAPTKRTGPRRLLAPSASSAVPKSVEISTAAASAASAPQERGLSSTAPGGMPASPATHAPSATRPGASLGSIQGHTLHAPPVVSQSDVVQIMSGFQDLMRQFLDTQRSVMQSFLQGYGNGGVPNSDPQFPSTQPHVEGVPDTPSPRTPWPQSIMQPSVQAPPAPMPAQEVPTPQNGTAPTDVAFVPHVSAEQTLDLEPLTRDKPITSALVPSSSSAPVEFSTIPDREELTAQLVAIVSERTGYPPEMLDLDLDLEADLGIDSIKRIEILGNFQKSFDFTANEDIAAIMEELAKIKTLRGVIEWVDTRLRGVMAGQTSTKLPAVEAIEVLDVDAWSEHEPDMLPEALVDATSSHGVQRFTLTAVESPLPQGNDAKTLAPGSVVLLTDDEHGVARCLATALQAQGQALAIVRMGERTEASAPGLYSADLTSHAEVAKVLDLIRQRQGPVAGIVHLLPLKDRSAFDLMDTGSTYARIQNDVHSLFYLAKEGGKDLKEAAKQGGACVIAATSMGGTFASVSRPGASPFFPGHGGVAGLIKTVAREWPEVRAKIVDTDPGIAPEDLASRLLQEMMVGDEDVEVGYKDSKRLVLRTRATPLPEEEPPALMIESSWVILLTGGARGITAEIGRQLAERYRPTLLLVGRTPLPSTEEALETRRFDTPRELKAAIMEQLRDSGEAITPAKVESTYNRLLKEREIRRNLHAMQQAGATVRYFQVDVCDEQALDNLIEAIYRDYGRLDGVVHGAGIIEDKLIEDKTPASFGRVFDTKVRSALQLSRKLKLDELSFLVFFSSMAGRFGNRGQCDYAAANEILNKLALDLDHHSPARIVSINWGPWESGMVSPELQKQFAQHGVIIVPRSVGRKKMDQELRWGRKGEVEVLIGGIEEGRWPSPPAFKGSATERSKSFPLIGAGTRLTHRAGDTVEIVRTLDTAHDLYLNDHRLDGKPVFPLTMALEMMAETATMGWPDLELVAIKDLRLLRGIVLDDGPKSLRVVARPCSQPSTETMEVEVSIVGAEQSAPLHYKAIASMAAELPPPPTVEPWSLREPVALPFSVDEVYRQWLFHGPLMAGIASVEGVGTDGIVGHLLPSSPARCLAGASQGAWLIDPVVMDSALQMIIIWSRMHWDMTPLPTRLQIYKRFGPLSGGRITCQLRVRSDAIGHVVHCDWVFLSADGQVLGVMKDAEGVCSHALNRLAQMKHAHD